MNEKLAAPSRRLLVRLLDQPQLAKTVPALPPRALLSLIDQVGLEDAGERVALATVEQLARMFDEDLWRAARAGEEERLDPARVGVWVGVLWDAGERGVGDRLAELPEDLVALALHAQVLVIDLDEVTLQEVDAELEKILDSGPSIDFGAYRVIARGHDGWDAVSTALTALDARHAEVLERLLRRLCDASSEWIRYNGGLYDVLTSAERLEEDAAASRDERRGHAGFVSAASARAFLKMPAGDVASILAAPRDAITRAYFREYGAPRQTAPGERAATESFCDELVAEAKPLLPGPTPTPETLLQRALAELDDEVAAERMRELGYLTNVLLAARGGLPLQVADEVLATCSAGLARAVAATGRPAVELLTATGCDQLFRLAPVTKGRERRR